MRELEAHWHISFLGRFALVFGSLRRLAHGNLMSELFAADKSDDGSKAIVIKSL